MVPGCCWSRSLDIDCGAFGRASRSSAGDAEAPRGCRVAEDEAVQDRLGPRGTFGEGSGFFLSELRIDVKSLHYLPTPLRIGFFDLGIGVKEFCSLRLGLPELGVGLFDLQPS